MVFIKRYRVLEKKWAIGLLQVLDTSSEKITSKMFIWLLKISAFRGAWVA